MQHYHECVECHAIYPCKSPDVWKGVCQEPFKCERCDPPQTFTFRRYNNINDADRYQLAAGRKMKHVFFANNGKLYAVKDEDLANCKAGDNLPAYEISQSLPNIPLPPGLVEQISKTIDSDFPRYYRNKFVDEH